MVSKNSVNYDDFGETFGRSRRTIRWEEIDVLLEKMIEWVKNKNGCKIADIGCGNGRLLRHILEHPQCRAIQSHFTDYIGLDVSKVLIHQAKADTSIRHVFACQKFFLGDMRDIEKILGSLGKFDVIFFIASFHHLQNTKERISVLSQVKKLLTKKGVIFMLNWNLLHPEHIKYASSKVCECPDKSADFMIKIGDFSRFYHAFSQQEIQMLAEKVDLKILEQDFSSKNSVVILRG